MLGTKTARRSNANMERTFQESAWKLPTKVTNELMTKIINSQLDIKARQFNEERNVVLTKTKSRKSADLNEIPPEYERQ